MITRPAVWLDGEPATDALLQDRGLHYGDGLFETLVVRAGRVRFADLHAARLARGCTVLGLDVDAPALIAISAARVSGDGVLKLIVTRGDAVERGYATTGRERTRTLAYWYPCSVAPPARACTARVLETCWGENPSLAGLKHLNRLEQVLARRELQARGDANEGVVRSASGLLASGTMSNLFLLKGRTLLTPSVDRCGIAGTLRAVVMREAPALGLEVREAALPLGELERADGMFFTNVRLGVWPVERLEGRMLDVPAVLRELRDRIAALED